jgi:hypothetical protein
MCGIHILIQNGKSEGNVTSLHALLLVARFGFPAPALLESSTIFRNFT